MKKLFIALMLLGGLSYFTINAATTNVESQVSSNYDDDYVYQTIVDYAVYNKIGLDKDDWTYGSAVIAKHKRTGEYYIGIKEGYVKYSRNSYRTFKGKNVSGYKYYCQTKSGYYFF
ncbi:MAG: hypothetical protein K2H74_04265 [Paramuribaculum sp.]|nr:hypothetical protein [Paramuribaculum sp.]